VHVRFAPAGRARFLAVVSFIRQENPSAASRFVRRAAGRLRALKKFPQAGRKLPEFPDLPHREVIIRPYRFFYRVVGETVWIVDVWHSAQQPTPPR